MTHHFVKDSILNQKDLKGFPPKSCSQQIICHSSSLLLKVDGVEEPVLAHSPFQTSHRDKEGNLITNLVVIVGESREEAQAFILDEDVVFGEVKGVKAKKIDKDLIDCDSIETFSRLKNIGNQNIPTLRNSCIIRKGLLEKFASEEVESIDKMMEVVIAVSLHREVNEDGDETVELIESGAGENSEILHYFSIFYSNLVKGCTLKACLPLGSALLFWIPKLQLFSSSTSSRTCPTPSPPTPPLPFQPSSSLRRRERLGLLFFALDVLFAWLPVVERLRATIGSWHGSQITAPLRP